MSGRIVSLHGSAHQVVQELLPWYVLDTLGSEEHALVREHLQSCSQCQADVDAQRKLIAVQMPEQVSTDVERAFARLRPQLTARPLSPWRQALNTCRKYLGGANSRVWMPWAIGVQFAAIAGLCVALYQPQPEAVYRGLGAAGVRAGSLVVVFKPQTTEQELRRILQACGARVVDGPTVTDAYLLDVGEFGQARALEMLRAEPAVTVAESMERQ